MFLLKNFQLSLRPSEPNSRSAIPGLNELQVACGLELNFSIEIRLFGGNSPLGLVRCCSIIVA